MKTRHWIMLFIITAAICIISAAALYFSGTEASVAEIYRDGELIKTVNLSEIKDTREIVVRSADNKNENIILAEHGRISIKSATCPDKLCVKQGWITNSAAPIVCLPNHVIVKIKAGKNNVIDTLTTQ